MCLSEDEFQSQLNVPLASFRCDQPEGAAARIGSRVRQNRMIGNIEYFKAVIGYFRASGYFAIHTYGNLNLENQRMRRLIAMIILLRDKFHSIKMRLFARHTIFLDKVFGKYFPLIQV